MDCVTVGMSMRRPERDQPALPRQTLADAAPQRAPRGLRRGQPGPMTDVPVTDELGEVL